MHDLLDTVSENVTTIAFTSTCLGQCCLSSLKLLVPADFGLAVFYDTNQLPRTDLGLEGTPWFLAPENLSSEFYPASDLWSAGVMTYQLLSGYLPFDDRRNRNSPALSQVVPSSVIVCVLEESRKIRII